LQDKKLGNFHTQDPEGQGAGQTQSEDILGDEKTFGFMTANEALRLFYFQLKFGKPEQNPRGSGFAKDIKEQVSDIGGRNGGGDDDPKIQMTLMGEQTSQHQGRFSLKEGPGKNNQITVLLEKIEQL
jgi:hypothetical protein